MQTHVISALHRCAYMQQVRAEFLAAVKQACAEWRNQASEYQDFENVNHDLALLEAIAYLLSEVSTPSLEVVERTSQQFEEF